MYLLYIMKNADVPFRYEHDEGSAFCDTTEMTSIQQKSKGKPDKMIRFYFYCRWAIYLRVSIIIV